MIPILHWHRFGWSVGPEPTCEHGWPTYNISQGDFCRLCDPQFFDGDDTDLECGACRNRDCGLCQEEYHDMFADKFGGVEMDSETISMKEEFWIKE